MQTHHFATDFRPVPAPFPHLLTRFWGWYDVFWIHHCIWTERKKTTMEIERDRTTERKTETAKSPKKLSQTRKLLGRIGFGSAISDVTTANVTAPCSYHCGERQNSQCGFSSMIQLQVAKGSRDSQISCTVREEELGARWPCQWIGICCSCSFRTSQTASTSVLSEHWCVSNGPSELLQFKLSLSVRLTCENRGRLMLTAHNFQVPPAGLP